VKCSKRQRCPQGYPRGRQGTAPRPAAGRWTGWQTPESGSSIALHLGTQNGTQIETPAESDPQNEPVLKGLEEVLAGVSHQSIVRGCPRGVSNGVFRTVGFIRRGSLTSSQDPRIHDPSGHDSWVGTHDLIDLGSQTGTQIRRSGEP
jgi:hypothetical protein